jgi:hypothetical protein
LFKYRRTGARERRRRYRFPIERGLRYRVFRRSKPTEASGTTIISSTGLLFRTASSLREGEILEAHMDWPVRRDHGKLLELVLLGRVVRATNGQVAMAVARSYLRNCGLEKWEIGSDLEAPQIQRVGLAQPEA